MSPIIMTYELMFRSGRTRPTHARSSGSEMLLHTRSLVGSIIDTRESSFRKRQPSRREDDCAPGQGSEPDLYRCHERPRHLVLRTHRRSGVIGAEVRL